MSAPALLGKQDDDLWPADVSEPPNSWPGWGVDLEADAKLVAELEEQIRAIDAGEVKLIDHEEVKRETRERWARHDRSIAERSKA